MGHVCGLNLDDGDVDAGLKVAELRHGDAYLALEVGQIIEVCVSFEFDDLLADL